MRCQLFFFAGISNILGQYSINIPDQAGGNEYFSHIRRFQNSLISDLHIVLACRRYSAAWERFRSRAIEILRWVALLADRASGLFSLDARLGSALS
jgi:hypothetical protein